MAGMQSRPPTLRDFKKRMKRFKPCDVCEFSKPRSAFGWSALQGKAPHVCTECNLAVVNGDPIEVFQMPTPEEAKTITHKLLAPDPDRPLEPGEWRPLEEPVSQGSPE